MTFRPFTVLPPAVFLDETTLHVYLRSSLEKDDHRLLFALLLNVNKKEKIFEFLDKLHLETGGETFFKNAMIEMTNSFESDDPDYNVFGLEKQYTDFFADLETDKVQGV